MRALLRWLWVAALLAPTGATAEAAGCMKDAETVVLLHGLVRSPRSMHPMAKALERAGYNVRNLGYPSREQTVEELARETLTPLQPMLADPDCRVHFVTHSMGGLLLRQHLSQHEAPGLGRVVMISPPNRGSEAVDKLRDLWLFRWLNGPAGQQLGTGPEALPARLPPADYELGVITGDFSINWLLSWLIPGPDDGKVAVERARLEGMRDFLVVHYSHPLIMRRQAVIDQALHFLRDGRFVHEDAA